MTMFASRFKHHLALFALVFALVTIPVVSFAADDDDDTDPNVKDYLIVKDLPFIAQNIENDGGLGGYLNGLFQLGIGIAVTLAVVMVVISGIQYMFSDVPGIKIVAKGHLQSVIWGLVLIFGSWLILNTINPNLVEFDFIASLEKAAGKAGEGIQPPPLTEDDAEEIASRYDFENNYGILVVGNICTSTEDTKCTNSKDLPSSVKPRLKSLQQATKVARSVIITGGAEKGHATHGPGKSFVDLRKTSALNEFITRGSSGIKIRQTCAGTVYSHAQDEFLDEEDHWHACLGTRCQIKTQCEGGETY